MPFNVNFTFNRQKRHSAKNRIIKCPQNTFPATHQKEVIVIKRIAKKQSLSKMLATKNYEVAGKTFLFTNKAKRANSRRL